MCLHKLLCGSLFLSAVILPQIASTRKQGGDNATVLIKTLIINK